MDFELPGGKYVVAVSGGVDSMVLLDVLSKKSELKIVVAHFNHGIRPDSHLDEKLVVDTAKNKYALPTEVGYGNLGEKASEEAARRKRYEFLESVRAKHNADAIITAHHQDDLIETAFLNILRGSGYRGLVAMQLNESIKRPFLDTPKEEIIRYAKANKLVWREDITNDDTKYLRNYIRKQLLPSLTEEKKQKLLKNIDKVAKKHAERKALIAQISQKIMRNHLIDRGAFLSLPTEVSHELIVHWLRSCGVSQFDKKSIERISLVLRTGAAGTSLPVKSNLWLELDANTAQFIRR